MFHFAVIVTFVFAVTVEVVMVKAPVDLPTGRVRVAGTTASELLLERFTTNAVGPAGPVKVTVPVTVVPPFTEFGLTDTPDKAAGFTVSC